MKEFKGKVAVITGGASGIGKAIAGRCLDEGMKVVLAGINPDNLTAAKEGSALIRVSSDVLEGDEARAIETAKSFITLVTPMLFEYLP